jgi:hypothetical protein
MTDKEKILDKIRKLKALANPDQNTSDNEIASALEIARKLMLEHGINESETTVQIPNEELGNGIDTVLGTKNRQVWISILTAAIDTYFDCKHFLRTGGRRNISIVFYGPKEQAEIASYCFTSVYNQVWALSNAYNPSGNAFLAPRDISRIGRREYREGLSRGLLERCKAIREEEQRSANASKITALAIRSDKVADEWLAKHIGKLSTIPFNSTRTTLGGRDFANGMRDSENLTLSKAALKA